MEKRNMEKKKKNVLAAAMTFAASTLAVTAAAAAAVVSGGPVSSASVNSKGKEKLKDLAPKDFTVKVSGLLVGSMIFAHQDKVSPPLPDFEKNKIKMQSNYMALPVAEIEFSGDSTLNNGNKVGFVVKTSLLNNSNTSGKTAMTINRAYAWASNHDLGKIEFGATDGAAKQMHYSSPWFVPGNGVDSPNLVDIALPESNEYHPNEYPVGMSTFALMSWRSNKIAYFSPRIAGFQFGASYTPDTTATRFNQHYIPKPSNSDTATRVIDLSVNFVRQGIMLGGRKLDVAMDAFYSQAFSKGTLAGWNSNGSNEPDGKKRNIHPRETGVGFSVSYMKFTLGGAYYHNQDILLGTTNEIVDGNSTNAYTIGLDYQINDKLLIGASYFGSRGKTRYYYRYGYDSPAPIADGALKTKYSFFEIGGSYKIMKGVEVGPDLQYITLTGLDKRNKGKKLKGFAVGINGTISF